MSGLWSGLWSGLVSVENFVSLCSIRETQAWLDHSDRKVRRAEMRSMSLYPVLREVKETEASQVSQDVRDLLGARAIKELKEIKGGWVLVEIWTGLVLMV